MQPKKYTMSIENPYQNQKPEHINHSALPQYRMFVLHRIYTLHYMPHSLMYMKPPTVIDSSPKKVLLAQSLSLPLISSRNVFNDYVSKSSFSEFRSRTITMRVGFTRFAFEI